MRKIILQRYFGNDKQTIGSIVYPICGKNYTTNMVFVCDTLELPDRDNQKFISRIPAGIYQVRKRWSLKFGKHFHILDVPDRTWILIHRGNYFFNSTGCIIVGDKFKDINNDGQIDVLNSKKTLKRMLNNLPERFELEIRDA